MGSNAGIRVGLVTRCCRGASFGFGFVLTVLTLMTMFWIAWCYFGLTIVQFSDTQRRAIVNYSFTSTKPSPSPTLSPVHSTTLAPEETSINSISKSLTTATLLRGTSRGESPAKVDKKKEPEVVSSLAKGDFASRDRATRKVAAVESRDVSSSAISPPRGPVRPSDQHSANQGHKAAILTGSSSEESEEESIYARRVSPPGAENRPLDRNEPETRPNRHDSEPDSRLDISPTKVYDIEVKTGNSRRPPDSEEDSSSKYGGETESREYVDRDRSPPARRDDKSRSDADRDPEYPRRYMPNPDRERSRYDDDLDDRGSRGRYDRRDRGRVPDDRYSKGDSRDYFDDDDKYRGKVRDRYSEDDLRRGDDGRYEDLPKERTRSRDTDASIKPRDTISEDRTQIRDDRYKDDDRYRSRDDERYIPRDERYRSEDDEIYRKQSDSRYKERVDERVRDGEKYRDRDDEWRRDRDDERRRDRDDERRRGDRDDEGRRERDDERYKDRVDERYKDRDNERYRGSADDRFRDRFDGIYREDRDDDKYRTRDGDRYVSRDDEKYKVRGDEKYITREEERYKDTEARKDGPLLSSERDRYLSRKDEEKYINIPLSRARYDGALPKSSITLPTGDTKYSTSGSRVYESVRDYDIRDRPRTYNEDEVNLSRLSRPLNEEERYSRDERRPQYTEEEKRISPTRTRVEIYSRSDYSDSRPKEIIGERRYIDDERDARKKDERYSQQEERVRTSNIQGSRGLYSGDKTRRLPDEIDAYRTRLPHERIQNDNDRREEVVLDHRSYASEEDDKYRETKSRSDYEFEDRSRRPSEDSRRRYDDDSDERYKVRGSVIDEEYKKTRIRESYDSDIPRNRERYDDGNRRYVHKDDDRIPPRDERLSPLPLRKYDSHPDAEEISRRRDLESSSTRRDDSVERERSRLPSKSEDRFYDGDDYSNSRTPSRRRYDDDDNYREVSYSRDRRRSEKPRQPDISEEPIIGSSMTSISSREPIDVVVREKRFQNTDSRQQSSRDTNDKDRSYLASESGSRDVVRPLSAKDVIEAAMRQSETSEQTTKKVYYPVFDPRVSNMTSPEIIRPNERRGTTITAKKRRSI